MKTPEQMSRAELLEELRRLQQDDGSEAALRRTILELQVYREEVRQQNEELIAAQKQLEWSRDRYADLFDSAPVGYVIFDQQGVVEEMNLAAAAMLERERESARGRPFLFELVDSMRFVDHLARLRRGEPLVVSEVQVRTKNGTGLVVEMRSRPMKRDGRELFRTTLSDLTERRRAEAERQELELRERVAREANEAKDRFLAVLSHELRNPLAAISAATEVLAAASLPEPLAETVERVRRNVFAEARLIGDLLDASRLRYGKLRVEREPVDLHAAVRDAVGGLGGGRPPELALEASEHVVHGDPMRIAQVLSNLLRNARAATAEGGEIRVATWNPTPGRVVVSVSDTGCGIEPEDLARIFSPFERSEKEKGQPGLGLGLPICKGLVDAHGGEIRARSNGPGRGARFDVELPTSSALPNELARTAESPRRQVPLRILLVEDHGDTAETLTLLLQHRGFEVAVADSVASALARADEGFDVLISDLDLPDGTGRDLVQRLAARGPLRAIALSGYGGDEDLRASHQAGFRAHLVKPVEPAKLVRAIERVAAA